MAAINSSSMNKYIVIGFLICLNAEYAHAQWTEKDSIWLANLLSGKDTIRLNPEFQKAIRNGTLINNDKPGQQMKMAAPSSTITFGKDFSEYVHKEDTSVKRQVAIKDLPPAVFWKYGPQYVKELKVITQTREQLLREGLPHTQSHDFDAMLQTIFKPSYSEKKRNAKRSGTWKNYNNLPTPDVLKKRDDYQAQQDSISLRAGQDSTRQATPQPATSQSSSAPN